MPDLAFAFSGTRQTHKLCESECGPSGRGARLPRVGLASDATVGRVAGPPAFGEHSYPGPPLLGRERSGRPSSASVAIC